MTTQSNDQLIRIDSVSRSFGEVVALDSVSIDIRENEFFALLGPSGCGKTTLLRVLAGFEEPDSGTVTLAGSDLLALAPNRRPINLMFQSYALFPHMSVEKNIAYGLEREHLSKVDVRSRVDEVLETVGLVDKAKSRPAQLSGGQRQRVALARAIVKRPKLLLLDEPLSALDRKVRAEMQLELKRLQHEVGITFVVVTHDQEEAMSMADRIAVMADGRVQQIASRAPSAATASPSLVWACCRAARPPRSLQGRRISSSDLKMFTSSNQTGGHCQGLCSTRSSLEVPQPSPSRWLAMTSRWS